MSMLSFLLLLSNLLERARDDFTNLPAAGVITDRFFSHVHRLALSHVLMIVIFYCSSSLSGGVITKRGTFASMDCPSSQCISVTVPLTGA